MKVLDLNFSIKYDPKWRDFLDVSWKIRKYWFHRIPMTSPKGRVVMFQAGPYVLTFLFKNGNLNG